MAEQQTHNEPSNADEEKQHEQQSQTPREYFVHGTGDDFDLKSADGNNTPHQASLENEAAISEATDDTNPTADLVDHELKMNQLKDQLLRQMAELENNRKRHKSQLEDASKFAVSKFAKDLIEVVENLFRATNSVDLQSVEEYEALKNFYDGVEMTKKNFLSTLERHGIKRIAPVHGEAFDPNTHEAVAHVPSPDAKAGTVVDMVQAGYQIYERLLRPAMVAVAKESE